MDSKLKELIEKLTNVINVTSNTGRIWQIDGGEWIDGDVIGGTIVCTYKTLKEASVISGVHSDNIAGAIENEQRAGGYYWLRNRDLED